MGISSYWYDWAWAYGGGSWSSRISFGPQYGYAQSSISFAVGGGYTGIGITHYETRPDPNGPNVPFDFGFDPNFTYPPAIDADQLTEVTFEVDTGDDSQVTGLTTVYLWD